MQSAKLWRGRGLSFELEIVMRIVCLFLVGEAVQGIYDLSAVPLAVLNVLGRSHYGNVKLAAACANLIPVYEINMCELSAVKDAVLYGKSFASAEEDRAQMPVGVHAGEVAGFVYVSAELGVDRTGVTVLMLLAEIRNQLAHDVEQVMLEIFKVKAVDVVRAFLHHY